MKKIIFLEGLPNVGKTFLINEIKKRNYSNIFTVDELINPEIDNPFLDPESVFLKNDEMKIKKYNDGLIIIDRGPISTLVYNQLKHLIDCSYDSSYVEKWFEQFVNLYNDENTFNFYLYNPGIYNPSLNDKNNPFGSIDNLKITHELTLFNLKKYAKNVKIINYKKDNLEEVINEIIN